MEDAKLNVNYDNLTGSGAQKLLSGRMSLNALRPFVAKNGKAYINTNNGQKVQPVTNATLLKDEWEELDEAVNMVKEARLNGINDLRDNGLTRNLGGLGTLIDQYQTSSDMTDADVDMAGVTVGEEDGMTFTLNSVPVPIIHKDFRLNVRHLEASRNRGDSLDTMQAELATRKVVEKLESILFNGSGVTVNGNSIKGYSDTGTTGTTDNWGTLSNIEENVLEMIKALEDNGYYGPYMLYVNTTDNQYLRQVYDDGSGQTARERMLNIEPLEDIKPVDILSDDELFLVQLTRDVVDLSVAEDVQPVEWEEQGGMLLKYKVMGAMVPRVKKDGDGNYGVAYWS